MSNKISIVVPTMWKFEPFLDFVLDLTKFDIINEIIIINNAESATPVAHPALAHPTVKLHNFDKNIYVNAAFNYGVAVAKNNIVALMNDDVIFDIKVFGKAYSIVKPGRMTAISPEPLDSDKKVTGMIQTYLHSDELETFHLGACMFIHRDDWVDIPAGIDLYYGDTWIFNTMKIRNNEIVIMKNMFFYSPTSVTAGELYTPLWLGREGHIYEQVIAHYQQQYEKQQARLAQR